MTTILVAAEAKWVRDQVRSAFVGPGQEVVEVTRGQDVRDTFAAVEPDLVVLDLQIGNMGGVAVAIDLRLEESGGRLPHARILLLLDRRDDAFIARPRRRGSHAGEAGRRRHPPPCRGPPARGGRDRSGDHRR